MKKISFALIALALLASNLTFATSDLDSLLNELSNLDSSATGSTTHNAGEVTIENISYTTDGKDLYTVTWTALVGSTKVKVEIKESKEADYFTLNTVNGSDGKIDVKLPTAGQYQIKLTAVDNSNTAISKEYIQTIKVDGVAPTVAPPTTTTTTPPPTTTTTTTTATPQVMDAKTGPEENVAIFTVLMGLMMYGVYRFRKTN